MCGLGLRTILVMLVISSISCSDVEFGQLPVEAPPPIKSSTGITEKFFQQGEEPKLDILMIVDNSPSMKAEQKKLGQRLSNFTDQLADVDWQIAVTNTDVSNGFYGMQGHLFKYEGTGKKVLNKYDPDYRELFLNTVVQSEAANCEGGCPSIDEQPLMALALAISMGEDENYELFRPGAEFVVIVISDEDEMSSGPSQAMKPRKVESIFNATFPEKTISVNGVIIEPGDRNCKDKQGLDGRYGTHVAEFAKISDGITTSICAEDYGTGLASIGQRARKLLNSVTLENEPLEGSLSVQFIPSHLTTLSVNGKKIVFDVPPPSGTEIIVNYEIKDEDPIVPLNPAIDDNNDNDEENDDD